MVARSALILLAVLAGAAGCAGDTPSDQPTATGERLVVSSAYAGDVTVRLVEDSGGETVFTNTYPTGATDTLYKEFEPGVAYRVLLVVGGEPAWNRTVYDYESYELVVTENGSVDVRVHVEV